ncbi:uncharacterized protein LOC141595433 [Silene latifolia]|uniref:uncharacterized protein LOC141595433 n=1 Tax=Silene latifolia TaxID=37657 RepID=UPI003D77F714
MKYNSEDHKQWFPLVWKNLAPPRYEVLLWAILWKRVATKDRVLKWKALTFEESLCTFCGEVLETVNHVFLHCRFSWNIWNEICAEWGMMWVCPLEIDDAFLLWHGAHLAGFEKQIWDTFFIAVVTIIWEVRNAAVFELKDPSWSSMRDLVVLRVGLWSKAWKENIPYSLEEWLTNWKAIRSWKEKWRPKGR